MIKIRLARKGRTHHPLYNIVVADVKAPRDGRFIEKLGHYDPHTAVTTVTMKTDRMISWLFKGAQVTEKVRNLCTNAGLLLTKHLLEGLKKGAISKKTAHQRLSLWQKMIEKRKNPKINFTPSIPLGELLDAAPYVDAPVKKSPTKPAKTTSKKATTAKTAQKAPPKATAKKEAATTKLTAKAATSTAKTATNATGKKAASKAGAAPAKGANSQAAAKMQSTKITTDGAP